MRARKALNLPRPKDLKTNSVEDIQNIVTGLKDKGIGILITDHNVRETLAITDKAYIMADGVILTEGSSEFLANDPEARKIYLGERFRM